MASPLVAMRYVHNAFRRDMSQIDELASDGLRMGEVDFDALKKRLRRLRRMFKTHELAEDEVLLPAVAKVAPDVVRIYEMDHEGVNGLFDRLEDAVRERDAIESVRACAAAKAAMNLHLGREEGHILPLCHEKMSKEDQTILAAQMAQHTPKDQFEPMVKWMFKFMDHKDRLGMIRAWKRGMPRPALEAAMALVKSVLNKEDWERIRPIAESQD